ncbi:HNH endonuclease [Clostridium fermenticellae]|uniref:HNH endonuclease n=1 Tax=Clostridium fermenticellae TaxID=2068654 RepID=A0A386H2J8_9CLOT|nr:HNH endonuclease [Clostridium fermenticellae]AYD39919.1 HNH endonuclease [Clostridium fermenticellae]
MFKCEVCGKEADKHHIVYRSQGGVDFPINFKYLCPEHHRGKNGPHKNRQLDLKYKLELQEKLEKILVKEFYTIDELVTLLKINKGMLKRLLREYKLYKEGYKKADIIYRLMGKKVYTKDMLENYCDFIANF